MIKKKFVLAVLTVVMINCKPPQHNNLTPPTDTEVLIGPENGYLVLAGGGPDSVSVRKFVSLAGKDASILLVPTAVENDRQNQNSYSAFKKIFEGAGTTNVEILHTRDTAIANSSEFISKLKQAKAVWLGGGNVRYLTEAYLHTRVEEELHQLLDRGGVIGGNSAGANVMGSWFLKMDTLNKSFETNNAGFNFLKNTCIIPHLFERNRQFWFYDFNKRYGNLLGIGIDAGTGVVIHKNDLQVIGKGYVAIYDGTMQSASQTMTLSKNSERFYLLTAGAKYDLGKRKLRQ